MNCPECGSQSKRWGTRRVGKHDESSYRVCMKCGTRWTEHRRILMHSVRRNATLVIRIAR